MNYKNREILIWLKIKGITNNSLYILLENMKDLNEIFNPRFTQSNLFSKIHPKQKISLRKLLRERDLEETIEELNIKKINTLTILDENYPDRLNYIYNRPCVLFLRGSILEKDKLSISIVGSRKSTPYGRWVCQEFARELSLKKITVVSGAALGIDRIAHKTALDNRGRTLAVLGNGLDIVYPRRNIDLYRDIPESGSLITEFSLGTEPFSYNFPQRNRIISGLSLATIVIEAEKKSGSLITAHESLDQGKDVFAVPGNINSRLSEGTNRLIKDGASPILKIEDLFDELVELREDIDRKKKDKIDYSSLSDLEVKIVKQIEDGPKHCDLISQATSIAISEVLSILTILEIKGFVIEISSKTFSLT